MDSPRQTSVLGGPLPSARVISNAVFRSKKEPPKNKKRTMMLMEWGQFIDHDMTKTPILKGKEMSTAFSIFTFEVIFLHFAAVNLVNQQRATLICT